MKINRNKIFFILQAIFKYLPFDWIITLRGCLYRPFFRNFGNEVRILDNVLFKYPDKIDLGSRVQFNPGCVIIGFGGLKIGSNVMLGHGTKIVSSSHNFSDIDQPMWAQGIVEQEIIIGDDVWLGFDVKVLGGSQIGNGVIVASGAVITGGVIPNYAIVAGVPGRVLRFRNEMVR